MNNNVANQSVLIVDDDTAVLHELRLMLLSNGIRGIETISDSSEVVSRLEQNNYSVVLMDWIMPGLTGAELLPLLARRFPHVPVIVITAVSDLQTVVRCIKQGAFDYMTKPVDADRLLLTVEKAFHISELANQNKVLKGYLLGEPLAHPEHFSDLITRSEKMQSLFKLIETVAPSCHPVLIQGETGVGKELIARAIHRSSEFSGAFVPLNVAGLDDFMFSDTLFGHKKGAFTGANEPREGLIAKAQGGTLFLDEIGDMTMESQVKLLRLLQEREYYRLGSDVLIKSDARIIAASNHDFSALITQGKFRHDLYQRLCFHELHIPPLRDRSQDIIPLVEHYVAKAASSYEKPVPDISRELVVALQEYDYPGNVRELISKIYKGVAQSRREILTLEDFPELKQKGGSGKPEVKLAYAGIFCLQATFEQFPNFSDMERLLSDEALKITNGNKTAAAELLGISRPTLQKKLAAFGSP
ncbi:sigma-54-dependent transcriptional response regulator [Geotalea daltonii FRC-32]|uniref:Sigma-54-dependent transcriptional response regulator n=1 Tax=Geotalea daltonii (strain DSM 22248 / JCM 15807 / FRC-32) TaxID=316067 RepID=B9M499_GEODF|nr:sigma-54 dependent transcriptional regulator [Geotalea daltonii]ACM21554.1 sigma-54-dependent transcriptional response regulator [Geotalea daltonii FRC-32]